MGAVGVPAPILVNKNGGPKKSFLEGLDEELDETVRDLPTLLLFLGLARASAAAEAEAVAAEAKAAASGKKVPCPTRAVPAPTTGETASTATGKSIHKAIADARRASGEFDLVQSPIKDKAGNPILVSKRVDLKTGKPQPGSPLQDAVPDAVSFERKLILDDKPLGRPIAKDRQEIIRFIRAYEQREGHLPDVIGITRYDPKTGQQVLTELYSPSDFLP